MGRAAHEQEGMDCLLVVCRCGLFCCRDLERWLCRYSFVRLWRCLDHIDLGKREEAAMRSEAVRQAVLKADDYRCQITGFDGRDLNERSKLAVHHVDPIGGGGPDTVENGITLRSDIHMPYVEDKALTIEKWDRDAGILEVIDHQGVLLDEPGPVPHDDLWFHRARLKAEGEEITTRLSVYARIERNVARDAYRLKHRYAAIEPGVSFLEYLASRGLNSSVLNKAALLYEKSLTLDLEWKDGVTATDYRRQLKDAGFVATREFWHVAFKDEETARSLVEGGAIEIHRCTDDAFADCGAIGLRVGKWFKIKAGKGETLTLDEVELYARETAVAE
jgi:hypothetical protein